MLKTTAERFRGQLRCCFLIDELRNNQARLRMPIFSAVQSRMRAKME